MTDGYTRPVTEKFLSALSDHRMLEGKRGVLLAYSGGADSSALLALLADLCGGNGIFLKAVHVHHGIRGAEADRDAAFCRETCEKRGVPFVLLRADIPEMAKRSGRGIEETARAYRYEAFERLIREDERLDCLATAHNADDNAETILFRLARGSGLHGLCGIPPVRPFGEYSVIRPLIACAKREIIGYCAENGIEYQYDATNGDTDYTRNYIRHEIMPRFETINPSFCAAAGRLAASLREEDALLDGLAEDFLAANRNGNALALDALKTARTPIALRAVRRLFAESSSYMLEREKTEEILSLCRKGREGSSLSLGGGFRAAIRKGTLRFEAEGEKTASAVSCPMPKALTDGENRFEKPDFAVFLGNDEKKENCYETLKNIYKLSIHITVNSAKIKGAVSVRFREPGDAFVFGGMKRRLKQLFHDRGFDAETRASLPLFCDSEGIIWIPGFPAADHVLPVPGEPTLDITYFTDGQSDGEDIS